MLRSLLLFLVGALILFAFIPIIGSLANSASEKVETKIISFTIEEDDTIVNITDAQFNALLSVFNGEAFSLRIITSTDNLLLFDNFQFVDPLHSFETDNEDNVFNRYYFDETSDEFIFRFFINNGAKFIQFGDLGFGFLGDFYSLTSPSEYQITLDVTTETALAPLLNLLPIIAVLVTISTLFVFFKFK